MPEPPAAVVLRAMEMLIPRLRGPGAWVSTEEMGLVIALAEAALALHKRVYGWDACNCSHREISATRGVKAWEEEVEHDAGCDWYTPPNREAREALDALAGALRGGTMSRDCDYSGCLLQGIAHTHDDGGMPHCTECAQPLTTALEPQPAPSDEAAFSLGPELQPAPSAAERLVRDVAQQLDAWHDEDERLANLAEQLWKALNGLTAAERRAEAAEAALRAIAVASDKPDDYDWYDDFGDPKGIDVTNNGDWDSFGAARGRWEVACKARAALGRHDG